MFNLLPGQGIGMSSSQELAFGLWSLYALPTLPETEEPQFVVGGAGYRAPSPGRKKTSDITVFDSVYAKKDDEIVEILAILFGVIE